MIKCFLSTTAIFFGYRTCTNLCEEKFPPKPIPELAPQPGYKICGYMGCPASKIEEIRKRERLLFFSKEIKEPQYYALNRTSWWKQMTGEDKPIVLQLEIREDSQIDERDLWHDPKLSQPTALTIPQFISYHPALPPEIQKKYDLQVRIHHVVTSATRQEGGGIHRAALTYLQK